MLSRATIRQLQKDDQPWMRLSLKLISTLPV